MNSLSRLNNNQKHFSILNSGKYNKHLSILSFKFTHLSKISLLVLILFNLFLLITNCFTFNLKADNLPFSSDLIVNDSILSKITSFEQIHFQACYKQGLDTSCGIATCASFLRFFYGINLDEKALIEKFFKKLEEKGDLTISLLDIKNVIESYGFTVKGAKIKRSDLYKYSMYTPILLHFEKPQKHFTLFIGSYGQYIFLSDPSIGVHFIDNNEFDSKFSGYALFIYGKDELKRWDVIHSINSQLQQKIDYLYLLSNISYR